MRRFLRIRILFVLIALLLVPTLTLPFAERLRTEWARYWEPRVQAGDEPQFATMESLRLLEELEQANYDERVRWARGTSSLSQEYATPNLTPIVCWFDPLPEEPFAATAAEFPATEAAATQERLLRAMEYAEKLTPLEFDRFDQGPMLSLPTEEYWAELKAREDRRQAQKP